MENKTISYLNSKAWYRALKVLNLVYVSLSCLVVFWGSIVVLADSWSLYENIFVMAIRIHICFLVGWLVSQAPKWTFYYIVLGSIKPPK